MDNYLSDPILLIITTALSFLKYILNQHNFMLTIKMFIIFILESLNVRKRVLKFDYDQNFYNNEINKHMEIIQNKLKLQYVNNVVIYCKFFL